MNRRYDMDGTHSSGSTGIFKNKQPCANCAGAQVKCDTRSPYSTELCKKCTKDGMDRCPPHMSRQEAIRWRKNRAAIFRPENSFHVTLPKQMEPSTEESRIGNINKDCFEMPSPTSAESTSNITTDNVSAANAFGNERNSESQRVSPSPLYESEEMYLCPSEELSGHICPCVGQSTYSQENTSIHDIPPATAQVYVANYDIEYGLHQNTLLSFWDEAAMWIF